MIEIASEAEMKEAMYCDALCKQLGHVIMQAYPNRRWYVEVFDKGKFAVVKVPEISMDYGVGVDLSTESVDNEVIIKRAAGELLERFKLTRGKTNNEDVYNLKRNHKGVIGAASGGI